MDTKTHELVRNFRNGRREWRPKGDPERALFHDFKDGELTIPRCASVSAKAFTLCTCASNGKFLHTILYDENVPRGRRGFHSLPFALPLDQNTGSVLFGMVL